MLSYTSGISASDNFGKGTSLVTEIAAALLRTGIGMHGTGNHLV